MKHFERITMNPAICGGKATIAGTRVTVGTILGMMAAGRSHAEILTDYPYLKQSDLAAALAYAAWRSEEREAPLGRAS